MSNKYIYLSSKESNNHADFTVQFPQNVMIKPHSQIRCVSCRVNPIDNAIEIDGDNQNFYIGVDFWNKINNAQVPLIPVSLDQGLYLLESGEETGIEADSKDNEIYINSQVAFNLNEAINNFCLYRNGFTCSIAAKKLTIKLTTMEMYGCPDEALPADVLKLWTNADDNLYDKSFIVGTATDKTQFWPMSAIAGQLTAVYHGITLTKKPDHENEPAYFCGPDMVFGLTGRKADNRLITSVIDVDLTDITMTDNDSIVFFDGFCGIDTYGHTSDKFLGWGADTDLNTSHNYFLAIVGNNVVLKYNLADANGEIVNTVVVGSADANDSIIKITCEEWETDDSAYYNVIVKKSTDGGSTFADILTIPDGYIRKNTKAYKSLLNPNDVRNNTVESRNIGIQIISDLDLNQKITLTCAVDDINDKLGFNVDKTTPAFGGRSPHNVNLADISRPLSIITDSAQWDEDAEDNNLTNSQLNVMLRNTKKDNADIYYDEYTLVEYYRPNADELSFDDFGIQVTEYTTVYPTYSAGLVAQSDVKTNQRSFPQYYLDLPSLPLANFSANYLQGQNNSFICPIDLGASGSENLYTSQLYTENYNTMTNTYPLNLNNMRVRICNIDGTIPLQLDKYTIVTIEIRDNPHIHNDAMLKSVNDLNQKYDKLLSINKLGQ